MIIPVILSGGSGSRLWPLSRKAYPKQLLNLVGEGSLLQQTVQRACAVTGNAAPLVICNQNHRFLVAEQLRDIQVDAEKIILEPVGRNTAPAIAIAALQACASDSDAVIAVFPADHLMQISNEFNEAIVAAETLANQSKLVTFGITPTQPETAYGYIKQGDALSAQAFDVAEFVEKPDAERAAEYLSAGGYSWNSGMFVFRADVYLRELAQYAPDILAFAQQAFEKAQTDLYFTVLDADSFAMCPDDSIDYAVMEKTQSAAVIPLSVSWSDLGSWTSLWDATKSDAEHNVFIGDVVTQDVTNTYIRSDDRLVTAVGVSDHVIVSTSDAVLVAHKDHAQDVKKIVQQLSEQQRSEAVMHQRVYRPWGFYESLEVGANFQVKRIRVNPGASLSLQMHHHRSEHWVVVSGTARVTRGEETFDLLANQSTYIPVGMKHRLENQTESFVEIIEVQSGDYLGEDDIVRFEDQYARC